MSFYQFPVAGFLGAPIYAESPSSTLIKEDFLVSFTDLEKIKHKIKRNELNRIPEEITNIIKTFNHNIEFINNSYKKFDPPEFQSFEKYCKYRPGEHSDLLRLEYEDKKNAVGIQNAISRNELSQLKQLGALSDILANKITRTIERLKRCDSIIAEQIPTCNLVPLAFDPLWIAPSLRKIDVLPEESQVEDLSSEPLALTQSEDSAAISATEPAISAPAPTLSVHADLTVNYNVGYGNSLGICCDPSWAESPIVLTNSGNSWTGQVPVNKDWKFVVLQNDRILKWENGANRRCNELTNALTINNNELKFS